MNIVYLNLILVGFRDDMPQKDAGTLALPPISLPIPKREPPAPIRDPSPPDDPPGVRSLFHGFLVNPQIGLLQPKLKNQNSSKLPLFTSQSGKYSIIWD